MNSSTPALKATRSRAAGALAVVVAAATGVALYLAWSRSTYRLGFPLDDAWIHQTYARNLAERGEWAFFPGETSAGSTSPLWTVFLTGGRLANIDPRVWAYLIGGLSLLATAYAGARWAQRREGEARWLPLAVGLTIALEWHLVWSAVSGMETILLAALATGTFAMLEPERWPAFPVGLVIGLGVWIRPDALTLLVGPGWRLLTSRGSLRETLRQAMLVLAGTAFAFLPYIAFLRITGGSFWPSTLYAKQAEYAILTEAPLLNRLAEVVRAPLVGVGGLLLLAALVEAADAGRRGSWARLGPLAWVAVYLGAYALRLPVTYQHGRYQMPVLPVLVVIGWCAASSWFAPPTYRWRWLSGRVWAGAVGVVLGAFWLLGGRAYAQDVAIIESEMVDSAAWIAEHTPPAARLAAHDIGALGYFGQRDLLDLAGLTDPELIPILRDEASLAEAMDTHAVDYLMTFPGWYPSLTACGEPVYVSDGRFSPAAGGENMVVYRWDTIAFARLPACMLYSP
jgi:hypothetical protein